MVDTLAATPPYWREGMAKHWSMTGPPRLRESDLLAQWVEDRCETGQDKSGLFSDLQQTAYQNYRLWCDQQGLRPFAKKSFTRGLIEQGFKEGRQGSGSRLTTYIGFRLNVS